MVLRAALVRFVARRDVCENLCGNDGAGFSSETRCGAFERGDKRAAIGVGLDIFDAGLDFRQHGSWRELTLFDVFTSLGDAHNVDIFLVGFIEVIACRLLV